MYKNRCMHGYIIAFIDVTDRERYAEYMKLTPAAIESFGGRFVVRGGKTQTLEGPEESRRIVVLEFPTFERARAFYHSDLYASARAVRAGAAVASFILVEGCLPSSI